MSTPLDNYPNVRLAVSNAFWLLGLLLGATQVGYAAQSLASPTWLQVAINVYAFLGGAVGYTAAANTPNKPQEKTP